MELQDVFPPEGRIQNLHCSKCNEHLDLSYIDFDDDVSSVRVRITGLPVLRCQSCACDYPPYGSRFAIIHLHDGCEARSGFARQAEQKVGDRRPDLRVDIGLAAALRLQSGLRDQQRMIAA